MSLQARLEALAAAIGTDIKGLRAPKPDFVTPLKQAVNQPFYFGHRGAQNLYPEQSLEGMRAVLADGFPAECDVRMTSDGVLVLCHDATTGRTMTGTDVDVTSLTWALWRKRRILPQIPNGRQAVPRGWQEVLDELGGRGLLVPEVKDLTLNTLNALTQSIIVRGLQKAVMIQSFSYSNAQAIAAAGCTALYLSDTANPVTMKADGIEFLGCSDKATSAYIAAAKAQGITVISYTIDTVASRQNERDKGVNGVFTNDPWWVSQQFTRSNSDPFQMRTAWPHLMGVDQKYTVPLLNANDLVSPSPGPGFGRIVYAPPRGLRRVGDSVSGGGTLAVDLGWAGNDRGPNIKVRMTVTFLPTAGTDDLTRFTGIYIGVMPSLEDAFTDGNGSPTGQNGYHMFLRRNGEVVIYKVVEGTNPTRLATTGVPATPIATFAQRSQPQRLEFEVNSTGLVATNLTSGLTVSFADTTFRPVTTRLNWTVCNNNAEVEDIGVEDL